MRALKSLTHLVGKRGAAFIIHCAAPPQTPPRKQASATQIEFPKSFSPLTYPSDRFRIRSHGHCKFPIVSNTRGCRSFVACYLIKHTAGDGQGGFTFRNVSAAESTDRGHRQDPTLWQRQPPPSYNNSTLFQFSAISRKRSQNRQRRRGVTNKYES